MKSFTPRRGPVYAIEYDPNGKDIYYYFRSFGELHLSCLKVVKKHGHMLCYLYIAV